MWDCYEETIVNNIMVMLIVNKYFNLYKNHDSTIDEQ